ncbi:Panacea domain-containing protein [Gallintestinimicrobium sp.]|uniref:Panacea domain-containing protein n=1 Tax=Gallintestinimicrobium sp. TaxID=2981655 RepID=UPI00399A8113
MVSVNTVASYIYEKYKSEFGTTIDEMKLHKLMYFAQRESIIQTGNPLFDATFRGWKYGPILKEIRESYKNSSFVPVTSSSDIDEMEPIVDTVFEQYAEKDSWSLSRLTHGEYSWKKSREGIPENINSDKPINVEDIRIDADRVRARRELLEQLGRDRFKFCVNV